MKKITNKIRVTWLIVLAAALVCHFPVMVNAESVKEKGEWKKEGADWFYTDKNGRMKTGWIWSDGYWYFMNPDMNSIYGKMMTGWQWIDGRCYYLSVDSVNDYPEGAMFANDLTPDGYSVDASGAWTAATGPIQVPGKGIQTIAAKRITLTGKQIMGGGSGGSKKGTARKGNKVTSNNQTDDEPNLPMPEEPVKEDVEIKKPEGEAEDIPVASEATPSEAASPESAPSEPVPSEARKEVEWNLYFVEEGNPGNEILKSQHGITEEGTELLIDFPETVLGTDRYYYHSLVSRPWSINVNGTGIQKYYIEYERGESVPEESDPAQETRDMLVKWLKIAKAADSGLTGEESSDQQIITNNLEESNDRLLNLVSMANGTDRKEIYLIAGDHTPNTVIISQTFENIKNLSVLTMDDFEIAGKMYTVMRIGFEKTYDEEICNHDYEVIDCGEPACTENGHETVRCRKCGNENTVILPATGHKDADHDGCCDNCQEPMGQVPEPVHYSIGDVQARTIGNRVYLFRCIDDDYEDALDNSRQTALFLCDCVIRPDIKLTFGSNNNYKYSNIREWLQDNAVDDQFNQNTYIGITRSYIGTTTIGAYEQFNDNSLMGFDRLYQSLEDKVFILSVEEALKYRDYLWKFNGSEVNNPESQISAYSKGYYLRTPQDSGIADFRYGAGIYTVSLTNGNIKPVDVTETSIGIRPVMTIPQG